LDQLSLEQTTKNQDETALSAGKYMSEDVYLKVQQGISAETGKASLTWEITRRFRFFSQNWFGILKCTASQGSLNLESVP
jgi:autotransporter translocation and assembly factor TamB